jgi:hypothetical protein
MMAPQRYQAWHLLYEQLPPQLRPIFRIRRPNDDPSLAGYTRRSDGREWRFPDQEDGRIADLAIAELRLA